MTRRALFIDCEFHSIEAPRLLSIGLVADDDRELYVEVSDPTLLAGASTFVLDTVAPQLGLRPYSVKAPAELGRLVGGWLYALSHDPIDVLYDYHADFDLLQESLESAGLWSRLKDFLTPTHIGYLIGQADVTVAMGASWSMSFAADGLARHHALADARALRAGYQAVHGEFDSITDRRDSARSCLRRFR